MKEIYKDKKKEKEMLKRYHYRISTQDRETHVHTKKQENISKAQTRLPVTHSACVGRRNTNYAIEIYNGHAT